MNRIIAATRDRQQAIETCNLLPGTYVWFGGITNMYSIQEMQEDGPYIEGDDILVHQNPKKICQCILCYRTAPSWDGPWGIQRPQLINSEEQRVSSGPCGDCRPLFETKMRAGIPKKDIPGI